MSPSFLLAAGVAPFPRQGCCLFMIVPCYAIVRPAVMNVVKWLTTSTMASYRLYELQSPEEAGKEGPPSLLLSYFLICRGLPVRKPILLSLGLPRGAGSNCPRVDRRGIIDMVNSAFQFRCRPYIERASVTETVSWPATVLSGLSPR
ncbi:hypothetical protein BJV77DRAFT_962142 [Russula vinacea]|nr:hypothetical protein BJV77DRAFT_962142 [Russula vinacea]